MKKLLILILIALLVALAGYIGIKGVSIGSFQILGITGIREKNEQLDQKVQEASKLVEKDYKQALTTLNDSAKKLEQEKQDYQDMTTISSEGDIQAANQIEKYTLETLWVLLGNHADTEGVNVKIDIVKGNTSDVYNLNITATGTYVGITEFISDIENDSKLGFKIEEFKMSPSGSELQATFTCNGISILDISETTQQTQNTNTTNTVNTANSTNNTNTTSKSNTTNSTANATAK